MNHLDKEIIKLKKDFPIFNKNPDLVYLDSAATSQRPKVVIDTLKNFMESENANINRGLYTLSEKAMEKFNNARKIIANFINSNEDEIVFTKNATEAFNLLAYAIKPLIKIARENGRDEIVLTEMEHHSNLVPWQELAKREKLKLKFIKVTDNYELDLKDVENKITSKTAVVSITHVSNILGTINPVEKIINLAKKQNAITIVDASQSAPNIKVNVKKINCDFLVFSGHKILGPTGIGILYGKKEMLNKLEPFNFGGGMIESVTFDKSTYLNAPEKFEAGTQNIAEAIATAEAIKYMEKIGMGKVKEIEDELLAYTIKRLKEIPEIKIYNPALKNPDSSAGIISFNLKGIHPHDVASLLNEKNIAIRAGHHCCMPLIKIIEPELNGVCRASFSFFNTKSDVDKLVETLKKIKKRFE